MVRILRHTDIQAPPEAVWRVIADFGGVASWAPAVREAHCTTTLHSGVGCARSVTASSGHTIEEVITGWDEGRSLTFQVPGGLARVITFLEETWSVEETPTGSSAVVLMEYRSKLGPFGAAVTRILIRPVLDRMLTENLAGLKKHVEASRQAACDNTESLLPGSEQQR